MLIQSRKCKLETIEIKYHDLNIEALYKSQLGNLIKDLYTEKSRMDFFFMHGLSEIYSNARSQLYPDKRVNEVFCNRAASKLDELIINYKIKYNNFVDICAGPGSMSDYLLRKNESSTGIGITVESDDESKKFLQTFKTPQ